MCGAALRQQKYAHEGASELYVPVTAEEGSSTINREAVTQQEFSFSS